MVRQLRDIHGQRRIRMKPGKITRGELLSLLDYDKNSGLFMRISTGNIIGSPHKKTGYIQISVKSKTYLAHHLAWLYSFGYLPKEIDHINGIKTDNRIENLREASRQENARNHKRSKRNTSGITGVYYHNGSKGWMAYIKVNYKQIYLGYFKNKEDAISARKEAEIKYDFHPNHDRE